MRTTLSGLALWTMLLVGASPARATIFTSTTFNFSGTITSVTVDPSDETPPLNITGGTISGTYTFNNPPDISSINSTLGLFQYLSSTSPHSFEMDAKIVDQLNHTTTFKSDYSGSSGGTVGKIEVTNSSYTVTAFDLDNPATFATLQMVFNATLPTLDLPTDPSPFTEPGQFTLTIPFTTSEQGQGHFTIQGNIFLTDAAAVPEPTSLCLFALGTLGVTLGAARYRWRRSAVA